MPGGKVDVFGKKKKQQQLQVQQQAQKQQQAAQQLQKPVKRKAAGDVSDDDVDNAGAVVLGGEPSRVPQSRVERAVKALTDFVARERAAKKKQNLLDEAETISVVVTLFKTPEQGSNKGIAIRIPHTLHPLEETRVCIFVKDDAVKPVKAKLEGELALGVDKVLSLTKLRTVYADHQKRRELCAQYDLFLADDRILPMLTKALGREFFKHKKQPRPIRVLRQNLGAQIANARDSTRLCVLRSVSVSVCLPLLHAAAAAAAAAGAAGAGATAATAATAAAAFRVPRSPYYSSPSINRFTHFISPAFQSCTIHKFCAAGTSAGATAAPSAPRAQT
jgi:hypothetical protein